ncbi:SpoIID/LytB domain-containing protein [Acetonema longum]|uniref:SpoIID/LytB domain protein n=1 Tax=Acetonema longum DSM 6540 TaxID=1009370 RepID=F7NQ92_9FIRM|nr:SpoIID/LytB domain-containing protein [Acetonema longum]EGO61851.1 SpoIID/LytB domain protein [Acetonema longum DSM 6540]
MKKLCMNVTLVLLFTFFSGIMADPLYAAKRQEPLIRVGLLSGQPQVLVSAESDFMLVAADSGQKIHTFRARETVKISMKSQVLTVNDKPISVRSIQLAFKDDSRKFRRSSRRNSSANDALLQQSLTENKKGRFLIVNRHRYRGWIQIKPTVGQSGLTVIEHLPLEQYVYGVIAKEISTEWPMEAVKAQAVAARNYGLYNVNKHKNDGYDVCPTVHCQVYGGAGVEKSRGNQAVDETRGQVITYQGKVIPAYFHASSGGHTENSEYVWGSSSPYLKGVPDFDHDQKNFSWKKRISVQALTDKLSSQGYKVGTLKAIRLSPLKQPSASIDRSLSGRVKTMEFIGSAGTVKVDGNKLRSMLGLSSTMFDVTLSSSASPGTVILQKRDIQPGNNRKMAAVKSAPMLHTVKDSWRDEVIITGFGQGHGVGLSQWGAKALAEKAGNRRNYYQDILTYYYQNSKIEKLY